MTPATVTPGVEVEPVRASVVSLGTLAEQIRMELEAGAESWQEAMRAQGDTLTRAIRAGELLVQAKAQCAHGEWLPWLTDNFEFTDAHARKLMKVARERASLHDLQPGLGLNGALKHLRTAKPTDEAHQLPERTGESNGHGRRKVRGSEDAEVADAGAFAGLPVKLHWLVWDEDADALVRDSATNRAAGVELARAILADDGAGTGDTPRLIGEVLAAAAVELAKAS